jgi:hypothetical protein
MPAGFLVRQERSPCPFLESQRSGKLPFDKVGNQSKKLLSGCHICAHRERILRHHDVEILDQGILRLGTMPRMSGNDLLEPSKAVDTQGTAGG